eukprot:492179-Pyramimonas_sp.AAC.1
MPTGPTVAYSLQPTANTSYLSYLLPLTSPIHRPSPHHRGPSPVAAPPSSSPPSSPCPPPATAAAG